MNKILQRINFSFSQRYPKSGEFLKSSGTTFEASRLTKNLRPDLKQLPKFTASELIFGKNSSDHMVSIPFSKKAGWSAPTIGPFKNLEIHPFNSVIHYAVQCFEGLKAYKNDKGEIRLFRPDCNAFRLKKSSMRLSLPDFDGAEFLKVLEEFVKVEERWIPPIKQFSLYLRPLHISMEDSLGVKSPQKSQLLIMAGPVGPYFSTGFEPISLSCATETIRSAHKGTGAFKIGGNYSPTLITSQAVAAKGHQQVLWLLDDQIIEVGASNIFFVFKNKDGSIQVATPDLEDLILPGVTRDSILSQKEYKISERRITITEVIDRQSKGQLLECFGAGTAVIVNPVKNIEYKGKNYAIPIDPVLKAGPISAKIRSQMLDIQEGRAEDKFGWIKRVK